MSASIVSLGSTPLQTVEAAALRKAGQDFEALLLEKLLAGARTGQSGPEADYRAMADRQLATDLAAYSPLGIARLLEPKLVEPSK
jgi:Rod binding domain-containing protein